LELKRCQITFCNENIRLLIAPIWN